MSIYPQIKPLLSVGDYPRLASCLTRRIQSFRPWRPHRRECGSGSIVAQAAVELEEKWSGTRHLKCFRLVRVVAPVTSEGSTLSS